MFKRVLPRKRWGAGLGILRRRPTRIVPALGAIRVGIFLGLIAILSMGASSDPDARFNDLGHRLMCTCGCGQVLLECNHVGCQVSAQMRRELAAAIRKNKSDDAVLNWFVEKYGIGVLAAPAQQGLGRLAWLMPYAALLAGIALTVLIVWMWRSRSRTAPVAKAGAAPPAALEALRRRVHEETEL